MNRFIPIALLLMLVLGLAEDPKKKALARIRYYFNDLPVHKTIPEIREQVLEKKDIYAIVKKDSCHLEATVNKYDRLNSIFYSSKLIVRCDSDTTVLTNHRLIITSYYSNLLASKKEYNRLVAEFSELLGKPEERKYGSKGDVTGTDADFGSNDKSLHVTVFWGDKEGEERYRVSLIYYK
ncbi:MAG: hypothetical protein AB1458_09630 [Bacteroidota bacterium]